MSDPVLSATDNLEVLAEHQPRQHEARQPSFLRKGLAVVGVSMLAIAGCGGETATDGEASGSYAEDIVIPPSPTTSNTMPSDTEPIPVLGDTGPTTTWPEDDHREKWAEFELAIEDTHGWIYDIDVELYEPEFEVDYGDPGEVDMHVRWEGMMEVTNPDQDRTAPVWGPIEFYPLYNDLCQDPQVSGSPDIGGVNPGHINRAFEGIVGIAPVCGGAHLIAQMPNSTDFGYQRVGPGETQEQDLEVNAFIPNVDEATIDQIEEAYAREPDYFALDVRETGETSFNSLQCGQTRIFALVGAQRGGFVGYDAWADGTNCNLDI